MSDEKAMAIAENKQHYLEMFAKWQELSDQGFYGG